MFALAAPPPQRVRLRGSEYRLVRVFKHDFWAATCLYAATAPHAAELPRVVVKFGRARDFCGLPLAWYARWTRARERAAYRRLAGLRGVPRWAGEPDATSFAIEYVDAAPLDHIDAPPPGFFQKLRRLMDAVHARGVGYCDANKRSNILVDRDGEPWLIDFQISIRTRPDWPAPLRGLVRRLVDYMQQKDLYHLYKHKRRLAPGELTEAEAELSRRRTGLHALHRRLTKPYRRFRRRFLRRQHSAGRLKSPTEQLEDHHQPEKATWRE
jgi:hypothetical protein